MSFPRYPAYKDSGVEWLGRLPEHWTAVRLKNVLAQRITDGPHLTPAFVPDGVPFLSVDGIQNGELTFDSCRYVSEDDHIEFSKKVLPQRDDVLMGKAASTGKIARVKVDFEFSIWSPLALIRVDHRVALPSFVEYALKSPQTQAEIDVLCTSNTQKNISMDDIPKLALARPPIEEQAIITEFLDRETAKIDALVAEQEQLITLLKEKRQTVISHAVTKGLDPSVPMKDSGVEWLGEVPEHWEVARVKHLVKTFEQGWSPQCESFPVESGSDWGVLKVGCVNGGIFNPNENKALPLDLTPLPELSISAGDLLISRANTRDLVGSAAVALADYHNLMLCDKLYRLRIDAARCIPAFLARFLATERVREQIELAATGASSSMLNISQSTILEMCVALPPPAEQQKLLQCIEDSTTQLNQLVRQAALSIELLRERRSALISAGVTGQIDVRGLAPAQERAA